VCTSFRKLYTSFVLLVLDTAAGVWLDRGGLVTSSSRTGKGHTEYDSSWELMRRCRHAAASVGGRIYICGGLKGGKTLKSVLKR
jgi:protein phosphatase